MAQSGGVQGGSRWSRAVEVAQVVTALIALAALMVTVVYTRQANETAAESLVVARDAQEQAESAAEKASALMVYIGGVPPGEPRGDAISELAVVNASPVDMYDVMLYGTVWPAPEDQPGSALEALPVASKEQFPLKHFTACTGYALPEEFEVERVYFFDGATYWIRNRDGQLEKADPQEPQPSYGEVFTYPGDEPYEPPTEPSHFKAPSCS